MRIRYLDLIRLCCMGLLLGPAQIKAQNIADTLHKRKRIRGETMIFVNQLPMQLDSTKLIYIEVPADNSRVLQTAVKPSKKADAAAIQKLRVLINRKVNRCWEGARIAPTLDWLALSAEQNSATSRGQSAEKQQTEASLLKAMPQTTRYTVDHELLRQSLKHSLQKLSGDARANLLICLGNNRYLPGE